MLASQQWSQVMTILTAEMAAGKRLANLKDLRKSIHLWTGTLPAAGVMPIKISEKGWASRRHLYDVTFQIVICTQSQSQVVGVNTTPANLDDAMAQLMPLLDDGAGNGVAAILRDPANFGLAGHADRTYVSAADFYQEIGPANGPGANPQILAYGVVTYVAEGRVDI